MQNLDFENEEHNASTGDFVEFDWDEALQDLEVHTLQEPNLKVSDPSCIFQRLRKLHREETFKHRSIPHSHNSAHLLDKLVQKGTFNMVCITLHPHDKGYYSLGVCTTDGKIFKESRYPYSQDLLLDYIDKEELPPPFLDYWEKTFPQLFYSGSVIVKIEDLRHSLEPHVRHILLRPHTQSLVNDINLFCLAQNQICSAKDKILVESTVVNSVQNPLCLDPSIECGVKRFHSNFVKNSLNTTPVRNMVLRTSQRNLPRRRPLEPEEAKKKPRKKEIQELVNYNDSLRYNIPYKSPLEILKASEKIMKEERNDKIHSRGGDQDDKVDKADRSSRVQVEYVFEPDHSRAHKKEAHACCCELVKVKLEVEKPENFEYVASLHVYADQPNNNEDSEVDKKKRKVNNDSDPKWSKCSFILGSKSAASRYIEHFTDIFAREQAKHGKAVKISHVGQPINEPLEFVQIGSNSTMGNNQPFSVKASPKISMQQLQSHTLLGKTLTADCVPEGTIFNSSSSSGTLSKITKSGFINNVVPRQKLNARKNNSKIRPSISSNASGPSLKIPIPSSQVNQRGSDQVLVRGELGIHSTMNVSAISHSYSNVNTSLKTIKPGVLRNVANVHSVTGALENSSALQTTVGLQTVRFITGPKEQSVTSNGQNASSSLSHSLPGLTALLSGPTIYKLVDRNSLEEIEHTQTLL